MLDLSPNLAPIAALAHFGATRLYISVSELLPMTPAAWITMIAVMTFVWGGLLVVLRTAVRRESRKNGT